MPSSKFEFAEEASVAGSPLISCNQGLEPASLVDGLSKFSKHSPLGSGKHDNSMDDIVTVNAAQELNVDASSGKSSKFKKKPFTEGLLFPESTAPEPEQNEGVKEKTPQTSFIGLGKSSLFDKSDDRDFGVEKSDLVVSDAVLPQHQQQDKQVPSSFEGKSETEKCQTSDNLEELHEGNRNLVTKQGRKKTIARKTLGSRPKLNSTANQKGSIYSNIVSLQNDLTIVLPGERTDHEKLYSANEPETSPDTFNVSAINEADKKNCTRTGDSFEIETNFMDDETEASEDKAVDLSHKADNEMELKQEGALHTTNDAASGMEESGKEEKIAADQLQQKDESTCKVNGLKGKVSKGKRQPSGKARTKTKTVPPVPEQAKATEDLQGKDICKGNVEEKAIERKKTKPCTTSKTKSRNVDGKKSKSSMEVEKENKPIEGGGQDINQPREPLGKTMVKSDKVSLKVKQKSWKNNPNCTPVREVSKQVKTEPVWFILSGHKLQRKEFQQVIRRLKGKVCRDSHQWSYQATHFITPDPIRRTEKFFAAAASGRWILKTDYLTACSQSGKFLDEEPYEWHKNGLSEDGAINLEAPRKWRRLREKTGHGAFYGMRIIIYGECIAPPLDTLKRVVKAGDGTILATSPPYTRFLKSGVDYAVVSPGMPRVDLWVQEFLQHEIPCIVADYLVEYVCKPGYSLERHVLYNTHAWAEKSFENLLSRAEEIVEDFTPPSDTCNSDDTACQACGSRDRGDVMLICGDESGSIGCGIGMHMDCFDPPLENIPEEDWFCPNCSGGSNSNSSAKRRRKGTSSLNTKYF
ncbi:hypothetical protein JCGZ_14011 [Jatropha curcas]|uniref:PHD-type domain-containing protein n=2 Tax=Jatropha curcas TaxID=180498 RepID=A0A067K7L6_JATCU|nr:hypothetical protein JCGZ_14011 [Jatropha curcas]